MNTHSQIPLYVLAGGKSSRFGSDKALANLKGRPLVTHVIEQFRPHFSHVTLIANDAEKYRRLKLPTVPDPIPGLGPLGGLLAACKHLSSPGWFLLSGCDTFFSSPSLIGHLLDAMAGTSAKVIAFKGDFWEPLPALYHSSILPVVRDQLAARELALWRLIEKVSHLAIAPPISIRPVHHINEPGGLLQLES